MKFTEKQAIKIGRLFQVTMMLAVVFSVWQWGFKSISATSLFLIPSHIGALLFAYCLYVLYFQKKRVKQLIITGPFKYTRHPMYTGLVLMSVAYWLPVPPNETLFFVVQGIFLVCLLVAGYCQEKETLARFGEEAEEYYRRTPRLFFCYPICR